MADIFGITIDNLVRDNDCFKQSETKDISEID